MKSDNREINHVLVRKGATIAAYAIEMDGRRYQTWLGTGRHDCEGYVQRGGSRYFRLRSADGEIHVVAEQELNMWRSARRVYRKPANTPPQATTTPSDWHPLWQTNIRTITPEKRAEVRRQIQAAAPKPLPGRYLGTLDQMGSFETWQVDYSIKLSGNLGTVCFERPGGQEKIGPYGAERLAEAVWDAGIDSEKLIVDLRKTGDAALAAFADEVEEVAVARGCAELLEEIGVAQEDEAEPPEVNVESQPAPQEPHAEHPPVPGKPQAWNMDDMCLFFCDGPMTVQVVWHSFEQAWYLRFGGYNDYTCYELYCQPFDEPDADIIQVVSEFLGVRNPNIEILRPKTRECRVAGAPAGRDAGEDAGSAK
jgi:hypothetical protein